MVDKIRVHVGIVFDGSIRAEVPVLHQHHVRAAEAIRRGRTHGGVGDSAAADCFLTFCRCWNSGRRRFFWIRFCRLCRRLRGEAEAECHGSEETRKVSGDGCTAYGVFHGTNEPFFASRLLLQDCDDSNNSSHFAAMSLYYPVVYRDYLCLSSVSGKNHQAQRRRIKSRQASSCRTPPANSCAPSRMVCAIS